MIVGDGPDINLLMEFMYLAPVGLVQTDLVGNVRLINPMAIQILMPLAKKGDQLTNLFTTMESVAPELKRLVADYGDGSGNITTNHKVMFTAGIRGQSDALFYAVSLVKLDSNSLMVTLQDVSNSVRRERLIQKQEAWINLIVAGVHGYGLMVLDTNGVAEQADDSLLRMLGYRAGQIIGHPYGLLYPPDGITQDRISDRLREVDISGVSFDEGWICRADGSRFWGHTVITPVEKSLKANGYSLVVRDITGSRVTMESLLKAASSDQLTGISNRRAFYEASELELARYAQKPRPISLLMLDIDYFKRVNDTYGHIMGDQVIRSLAAVLQRSVRSIDVVARLGGEEFAILLPSTDLSMAVVISERIRKNVAAEEIAVGNEIITYTVSIGAAMVEAGMTSTDELIAAADELLYAAKQGGRNQVRAKL